MLEKFVKLMGTKYFSSKNWCRILKHWCGILKQHDFSFCFWTIMCKNWYMLFIQTRVHAFRTNKNFRYSVSYRTIVEKPYRYYNRIPHKIDKNNKYRRWHRIPNIHFHYSYEKYVITPLLYTRLIEVDWCSNLNFLFMHHNNHNCLISTIRILQYSKNQYSTNYQEWI